MNISLLTIKIHVLAKMATPSNVHIVGSTNC